VYSSIDFHGTWCTDWLGPLTCGKTTTTLLSFEKHQPGQTEGVSQDPDCNEMDSVLAEFIDFYVDDVEEAQVLQTSQDSHATLKVKEVPLNDNIAQAVDIVKEMMNGNPELFKYALVKGDIIVNGDVEETVVLEQKLFRAAMEDAKDAVYLESITPMYAGENIMGSSDADAVGPVVEELATLIKSTDDSDCYSGYESAASSPNPNREDNNSNSNEMDVPTTELVNVVEPLEHSDMAIDVGGSCVEEDMERDGAVTDGVAVEINQVVVHESKDAFDIIAECTPLEFMALKNIELSTEVAPAAEDGILQNKPPESADVPKVLSLGRQKTSPMDEHPTDMTLANQKMSWIEIELLEEDDIAWVTALIKPLLDKQAAARAAKAISK
jgi:hypothetical protein